MKQKTSIAASCIFALLLQNVSAYASSWNPGLLVNTETFQIIDDTDSASDLYVRFGDALNKRLTFERTLDRFNFNDDVYVSGDLNVKGTASGKTIFATESLRSSGSLVWEGAASGASLWVSTFQGAGLTSCNADGETLGWNSVTKRFECGDDDSGGGSSYYAGQGLSMNASNFFSLSSSFTGTSLEIMGTASGRHLHAQDRFTSSGSLLLSGAQPKLAGTYDTSGEAYSVAIAGRYAYVADAASGLQIIDISNPTSPILVSTYNTSGNASDIAIAGRFAYIADYTSGLQIIDVSNPTSPILVGTYNTSGNAYNVAIAGRYAYVADQSSGLQIIDVSNSASPKLVGTYDTSGTAHGVAIAGRYAYVADSSGGLQIIDVSNPASPTLVGTYDTSGDAYDVAIDGRYVYIGGDNSGLQIIDVSNPASPTLVGTYNTSGGALDVAIAGRYAYVADDASGLQIIDVSNPASPLLVGTYDTSGNAFSVTIAGRYAYVGDYGSGLQVINIQGIDAPSASIGAVEAHSLSLRSDGRINGNLSVDRAMNIGDGLYVFGQTAMRAFSGVTLTLSTQDRGGAPALNVVGTASGTKIFAQRSLATSGTLVVESTYKEGSGAISVTGQEYQTGAYLYASGAAVLALDSYGWTQTGARLSPHIMFGYRGVFDVSMYRHGTGSMTMQSRTKTGTLLTLDSETTTATNNIFKISSDVNTGVGLTNENLVFRVQANGATFADGAYSGAGADLAEWFATADPGMKPGDLVCLDPKRPLHVKRCNSTKLRIIGIVSTKPGFIGGEEEKLMLKGEIPVLVGLLGQIPTKVTGTVEIGDIIGLSRTDGVGSRLEAPGQSVCTALEPHEGEGIGVITCLAPTLQFWTGSIQSTGGDDE